MPKVLILRGNSGSGKSTVAYELRKLTDPIAVVIEQDYFRNKASAQKGEKGRAIACKMMLESIRIAIEEGREVILDGIFRANKYTDFFNKLIELHPNDNYFFYFDISLNETIRRHGTRLKRHEFGGGQMKEWFKEKDLLKDVREIIIDESRDIDSVMNIIKKTAGF